MSRNMCVDCCFWRKDEGFYHQRRENYLAPCVRLPEYLDIAGMVTAVDTEADFSCDCFEERL